MRNNWRKDIRSIKDPSLLLCRPSTPPLLRSINKRSRNLKKKHIYQNSQLEWITHYNKLTDEYQKIEAEINGLHFNLHYEISQYREEYLQWKQSVTNMLSNVNQRTLHDVRNILNANNDKMNFKQQELEAELNEIQRSIKTLPNQQNHISMRKENLKYHEFCLESNICSSDKYGGWTYEKHQRFIAIHHQYKSFSFKKFYDQAKLHFADTSKTDIKVHYEWYRLYLQHIATNKRMRAQNRSKKKLMVKQAESNKLIQNSLQRLTSKENFEKEVFDCKLRDLHGRMDDIQEVRTEQMKQQKVFEGKKIEEERVKVMEEHIKWNEYRNDQKGKLNEYYQDKISKLEAMEIEANRIALKEKVVQQKLNKVNRRRIEYRENKRNEKIQIQKEWILKKEEEVAMKEQRLEKLRVGVKKQLNHDNIENASGILKNTKSVSNRIDNDQSKIYNEGVLNLYPDHTYSDQKLFDDPKFVLMNHLIANNLHTKKYAKQCINNMQSSIKPRKDCNSSDIFS